MSSTTPVSRSRLILGAAALSAVACLTGCGTTSSGSTVGPTPAAAVVTPSDGDLRPACAVSADQAERRAATGHQVSCAIGATTRSTTQPCHLSADAAERYALRYGASPCSR